MRGESRNWAAKFAAALFVVVMACGAMYGQDIITNYLRELIFQNIIHTNG